MGALQPEGAFQPASKHPPYHLPPTPTTHPPHPPHLLRLPQLHTGTCSSLVSPALHSVHASVPVQVSLAEAEKRAKELGWQVKMMADATGTPGGAPLACLLPTLTRQAGSLPPLPLPPPPYPVAGTRCGTACPGRCSSSEPQRCACHRHAGKPECGEGAGAVAVRGAGVAGSAMRVLDLFGCAINYDRRGGGAR
jgi:hypothetical protein